MAGQAGTADHGTGRVEQVLGTRYPLIQAPMNWLTDARLVSAVSEAGGLGVLGTNAGQRTVSTDPRETAERTRAAIRATRELTDRPFGLNLILSTTSPFSAAILDVALEEHVGAYITVGAPDAEVFARMKADGAVIVHRPPTPTLDELHLAEDLGADLIVATGYDEGGITPRVPTGTFSILPAYVDAARVPVLAAGGIADERGVRAARALGAEGVFIGTRFLVTRECPMAPEAKRAILASDGWDVDWVAPSQRSILTPCARLLAEQYRAEDDDAAARARLRASGGTRLGMLEGRLDEGIISVSTATAVITDEPTAGELVERLMAAWES